MSPGTLRLRAACAVTLFVLVALTATVPLRLRSATGSADFRAFYCAAKVELTGGDPYLAAPLFSCEKHVSGDISRFWNLPAPIPGATILAFEPLTRLQYYTAAWLWAAFIIVAAGVTMLLVQRITGLGLYTVIAALALSDMFTSLLVGQIAALSITAIVAAAWSLDRERPWAAAVFATSALIEPHIGAAAVVALAARSPASRVGLGLGVTAFLALSVLGTGLPQASEYLRYVLPVHGVSELYASNQYSLSSALAALGAPARLAAVAGSVSFAVMTVVGILYAPTVARSLNSKATLILVPVAASVIGGPFIHDTQIAVAVPLALLFYARRPSLRSLSTVLLVAIPFGSVAMRPMIGLPLALIASATIAWSFAPVVAILLAGTVEGLALALWAMLANVHIPFPHAQAVFPPAELASETWRIYHTRYRMPAYIGLLFALPTWTGLIALLTSIVRVDVSPRAGLLSATAQERPSYTVTGAAPAQT